MQTLERRICALERASPSTAVKTIIRRFLSPGDVEVEIHSLRGAADGELWTRLPGETEQELIDRATVAVTRNHWGFAVLTMAD